MKTQIGAEDIIQRPDGEELEVIVREVTEDDDAIAISYFVPDWSTQERPYVTQPYHYPKRADYSGIEKTTGMPKDYAGKMLEDFNWEVYRQDVSKCKSLIDNYFFRFDEFLRQNLGLYIYSRTRGSGKTFLSCCIGNEIIKRRGLNVKFISMVDYIQAARKQEAGDFRDATVLIVDDIGSQDEKHEWIAEFTFGLINHRYEKQKMTIFTSNLDPDHCSGDDRIISRVDAMTLPLKLPEVPVRKEISNRHKDAFLRSISA